ncbi:VOC family protein [Nocardia implantans]|uniref:VOC family protein n=1 Tax=Nocardia implantans TaxID=3108168 RepID=A0ABU6B0F8_9NOCA|nr:MULTISPECIES: VOC family protein [unclassified Nocardia]MBF6195310.1 VOC family protein [Nocardia beijingensis]MEA3530644.1 VOC family protein [Nocardia sp. CDC192]MEB3513226.1 VOC family protein [Nocardia sp. CDC186]
MSLATTTHLNFRGDARAALEFYRSVFGGHLAAVTYEDAGNVQVASEADRIMWGQVEADNGFRVMAYDVPARMGYDRGENSFFVSVRGATVEEVSGYWDKLTEGATIVVPMGPAGWSPAYGMLRDRFGVVWVLDVVSEYNG